MQERKERRSRILNIWVIEGRDGEGEGAATFLVLPRLISV